MNLLVESGGFFLALSSVRNFSVFKMCLSVIAGGAEPVDWEAMPRGESIYFLQIV